MDITREHLTIKINQLSEAAQNTWNQLQRINGMIQACQMLLGDLGPAEATPPPPASLTEKEGG